MGEIFSTNGREKLKTYVDVNNLMALSSESRSYGYLRKGKSTFCDLCTCSESGTRVKYGMPYICQIQN